MKRAIDGEEPSNKKQEIEATAETRTETIATEQAEPEARASREETKEDSKPTSGEVEEKKPAAAKPNPLFSGAFGSTFGKSMGFSAFGGAATSKPSANPWAEPESDNKSPFAEPKPEKAEPESKDSTPEQEDKQEDQFAVVSLEKQQLKTGEEEEQTIFKARSKLYCLNLKNTLDGWKERGVGTLHLNVDEALGKHRILMRADTLFKVILNATLSKNTEIHKGFQSSAHAAKFVRITTTEQGELLQFAFRLQTSELADEFYDHLVDLIKN